MTYAEGWAVGPEARSALADLRRARRRRRTRQIDVFEALYKAYITAILGGIAVWVLSGLTGDHRLGAEAVQRVLQHGPQVVGLVVGIAWAVGVRSGGRGGPLVVEAADVRHVLLAPLSRNVVLRPVALRQLRFGAFVGLVVGAIAGVLAFRRLPGPAWEWVACGAVTGAAAVAGALGLAMIVSGRRLGRLAERVPGGFVGPSAIGSLLAVLVVGWSVADLIEGTSTSPATWLGWLALGPLGWRPEVAIGVAVALAAVVAGAAFVPGCSIEAAERRATLAGQIRFAATMRDLRTVVVLRRQLAQELPRQRRRRRPAGGVRVTGGRARALATSLGGRPGSWAVSPAGAAWGRGWHGIARFPWLRTARLAVLGAAAGASAEGTWHGTTPLVIVAGIALYVAALDVVEPLAQELDHPDRRDGYPIEAGELYLGLAGPSMVLMVLLCLLGAVVAFAVAGGNLAALEVGLVMALPAAGCALAGAVTSVVQGPPTGGSSTDSMLPPEMAGARAVVRMAWPPLLAIIGVLPVLAVRHPSGHGAATASPVAAVGPWEVLVALLVVAAGVWLRKRERIHASFRDAMAEAAESKRGAPARGR